MPKTKKLSQSDFFTKPLSNKGVKKPLTLPDGTGTDHWLVLLSTDSDTFKSGCVKINQNFLKSAGSKQTDLQKIKDRDLKGIHFIALLVKDWSFSQECSFDNVVEFLKNTPAIVDQIDNFTNQRRNFFVKPL